MSHVVPGTGSKAHEVDPVPWEARPFQGQPAGIVTRTAANAIDFGVSSPCLSVGYLVWCAVRFLIDPAGFTLSGAALLRRRSCAAPSSCSCTSWSRGRPRAGRTATICWVCESSTSEATRCAGPARRSGLRSASPCRSGSTGLSSVRLVGRCRTPCCGPPWSTTGPPRDPSGHGRRMTRPSPPAVPAPRSPDRPDTQLTVPRDYRRRSRLAPSCLVRLGWNRPPGECVPSPYLSWDGKQATAPGRPGRGLGGMLRESPAWCRRVGGGLAIAGLAACVGSVRRLVAARRPADVGRAVHRRR